MNTKQALNVVDGVLVALGTTYGLAEIESILGITILVVQIIWLLVRGILKIVDAVKKKDIASAIDAMDEMKEEMDNLKENDKKEEDEDAKQ